MKKLISLCLALALVLSMCAGIVLADDAKRDVVNLTMLSEPANDSGLQTGNWMGDYLMDELQITVELIPNADGKLAALLAADALPDLVIINTGTDKIMSAVQSGQLVALSDHQDALPNAYKYLPTAIQYYCDNMSNGDGKCYMLSSDVGPVAGGYSLNFSTSTRWDLYAKLGYPEIKTIWDYQDVLVKMQELEPTNADGQKVYAVSGWSSWDSVNMQNASEIMIHEGKIGLMPFTYIDETDGTLIGALDEGSPYLEGLRWYFQANQKGILDPDSMTQTWNSWIEKMTAGRVLFALWDWGGSYYNTADRTNADEPTGFAPVVPTETKVRMVTDNKIGGHWSWGIGKNTQYLDRCLEYVDFMSNPDKLFVLMNGPKGEAWDLNEDGKPYLMEAGIAARADSNYTFSAGGRMFNGTALINSHMISSGTYSDEYQSVIAYNYWDTYTPVYTKIQLQWQEYTGYENIIKKLVGDGTWTQAMNLAGSLVVPMSDDMQIISNGIGDIVQPASWQAVYAADEAEFNAIIAQMVEDANALGYQDLIAYNTQSWADAVALASKYE